jgi:threonylcarbamoyladenosine tRNA methylthiotransferase MtaB
MCSYCLIPFTRGKQRCLSHTIVLNNIKDLINSGFKEIVLTGVNTAGYCDGTVTFLNLLQQIDALPGEFRIRISSLEPFQINDEIIAVLTNNKNRWCQAFHLCLQSANNDVLQQMNRKYTVEEFIKLVEKFRHKSPLCSITTDYIVGFPTETKEQFEDGCANLKILRLANLHIFPYSIRRNTVAAKLKSIVSSTEKTNRSKIIAKLNAELKHEYLMQFIGKKVAVLYEKHNDNGMQTGDTEYFFKVYKKSTENLKNKIIIETVLDVNDDGVIV